MARILRNDKIISAQYADNNLAILRIGLARIALAWVLGEIAN